MACSWAGWPPLQQRLVRSGAVEGLRYVESLDVTKPGYDLHSLLLALQAEAPLEEPGRATFDGLPRALRVELLLLLSWLLPRLPREPLRGCCSNSWDNSPARHTAGTSRLPKSPV